MEQDGQLTSYCNNSLAPRLPSASRSQMQTPLSKRQVSSMRSKDLVGALDQQTSKVRVASLGNAKLRIVVSGLAALRLEAQITTHIATLLEPLLVP